MTQAADGVRQGIAAAIAAELAFKRVEEDLRTARRAMRATAVATIAEAAKSVARDSLIIAYADNYWSMEGLSLAGPILNALGIEHINQILDAIPEKGIEIPCDRCGSEITARSHEDRKKYPTGHHLPEGIMCGDCVEVTLAERHEEFMAGSSAAARQIRGAN